MGIKYRAKQLILKYLNVIITAKCTNVHIVIDFSSRSQTGNLRFLQG